MKRSGTPGEVASAWLASVGASYITGQCIVIDGGNSLLKSALNCGNRQLPQSLESLRKLRSQVAGKKDLIPANNFTALESTLPFYILPKVQPNPQGS
jgi:hypothetical protein